MSTKKEAYPRSVRITNGAYLKVAHEALKDDTRPAFGEIASALILAGKWPLKKAKKEAVKTKG
jgi:hypothetical protein